MKYLIGYLLLISIISFFTYGIDKYLAIKKRRRISEHTLLMLSLLGGVIGSILGMFIFHHKTRKIKFYIGNILAILLWIGVIYGIRGFLT